MVAEPVQATLLTLNRYYDIASSYVSAQQEKISQWEYLDTLSHLNPLNFNFGGGKVKINNDVEPFGSKFLYHVFKYKVHYLSVLSIGIGVSFYKYNENLFGSAQLTTKKRRKKVPKLANGARRDVVLIIGSATEPLTRLIALDFEKRGFIVYLTILDEKDFRYIESNPVTEDMNYLNLNEVRSLDTEIANFRDLMSTPVIPFVGAESHQLRLKSILFAPNLYFPIGPIENITVASWNRLTERFTIYLKLLSAGLIDLARNQNSKIILIIPNIISSLKMPYHCPETIFQNSLKDLFLCLTRELHQHNISVTQIRLGNINIFNQNATPSSKITNIVNSEVRSWKDEIKDLYAASFTRSQHRSNPMKTTGKGTSLKDLYYLLFDLIYSTKKGPSTIYFGTGARTYDSISRIVPDSIIDMFLR